MSKEIAQVTGLTPSTVDTYLKGASAILGTPKRREAARKFAESDPSQRLGSQPEALSPPPAVPHHDEVPRGAGEPDSWFKAVVTPPIGGAANDLTSTNRLIAMLRVAGLMAVVMTALILFAIGALKLLS